MGDETIHSRKRASRPWVPGDPAGVKPLGQKARMFDTTPDRNIGQPGITRPMRALPDRLLIATLVDLGCPQWSAEQIVCHPSGRFAACQTWCLVQDAAEGRHVTNALTGEIILARELVDAIRAQYAEARKVELISDDPEGSIGLWER